jgi:hypothetical protein
MKQKSLTLEELAKSWWWNREDIHRDGVTGVDWPLVKEAARNYELMRRSPKGKQFTQTYLELDREGRSIVHTLWPNWSHSIYRFVRDHNQFTETGWTPIYENQFRQWNLRLADKKLTDEFIREIRLLREIQKIPVPRRNRRENHRGASWKLIEILDRKQNGIGKFNDSERHTLTEAQRRAEKYFVEYERALDDWKNDPNPAFIIGHTDDPFTPERF